MSQTIPFLLQDREPLSTKEKRAKHFADLEKILIEVMPKGHLIAEMASRTMQRYPISRIETDRLEAFYDRLAKTDRPTLHFYARCGRLALAVAKAKDKQSADRLTQDIGKLRREYAELDVKKDYRLDTSFAMQFSQLLRTLSRYSASVATTKRHSLPPNPVRPAEPKSRIVFRPTAESAPWAAVANCDDKLDLYWSPTTVAVSAEPTRRQTIYEASSPNAVLSAGWDGRHIWVATSESGVVVLSVDGKVLGKLTPSGSEQDVEAVDEIDQFATYKRSLPPYQRSGRPTSPYARDTWFTTAVYHPLLIVPVSPGHCIAVGRYGRFRRLWFASLKLDLDASETKDALSVKVFHIATRLPQTLNSQGDHVSVVFQPNWITMHQHLDRRVLLMGRSESGATVRTGRFPLAVNPVTLETSLWPLRINPMMQINKLPRISVDGRIVHRHIQGIDLYAPAPGQPERLVRSELVSDRTKFQSFATQVIVDRNHVHVSGSSWYRIDRRNWKLEEVASFVPNCNRFEHYASSLHHGMVAWNRGDRLYSMQFDAASPTSPDDLAELYPRIPSTERSRHHQAAQAIREFGGYVGSLWAPAAPDVRGYRYGWRTVAHIPKDWSGGNEGLEHLTGLSQLKDLTLVQANVTNAAMSKISTLKDLESLSLVETKVTDDGLTRLRDLPKLQSLHLEGTVGGQEFTDRALTSVDLVPRLHRIVLYGPGFTDQAVGHLTALRFVQSIYLLDTGISSREIAKMKSGRSTRITIGNPRYDAMRSAYKYSGPAN